MRREERRNLRPDAKKSPTLIFVSLFWFSFFFFLFSASRRAETKNSRRWENMIFILVSLTFDVFTLSGYSSPHSASSFVSFLALTLSPLTLSLLLINLNYVQLRISCTRFLDHPIIYTQPAIIYLLNITFLLFFFFTSWKIKLSYSCQMRKCSKKFFCCTFIYFWNLVFVVHIINFIQIARFAF